MPTKFSQLTPLTTITGGVIVPVVDGGGSKRTTALNLATYVLGGNAASASKLQSARTINGVAFDGTSNITIPASAILTGTTLPANVVNSSLTSVGTLTNLTVTNTITGSISGNAGSATKLQTPRTINGVAFDGTADITISGGGNVTLVDASTTVKGIASFNAADFTVASGAVSIKAAGVGNSQLENSSITIGADPVSLGGTITALSGLTNLTVDNININDNVITSLLGGGNISIANGTITINGNLLVTGTSNAEIVTNLAATGNMLFLNNAIETTITNVVGNGTNVVYTTLEAHNYQIGYTVTITGVTPSAYNLTAQTITNVSTYTFTVANSATGLYVSGGTADAQTNTDPDLGFAGAYYDGGYFHTGFFRDATDGYYKVFKGYTPEPYLSPFINTSDPSFALADIQAANFRGNLVGNADTVTNGVYTTGSYADPSWITSLAGSKVTNAVLTTGSYADPSWITSLGGSKISGAVGSANNVANGAANRIVYQTGASATSFVVAPTVTDTYLKWNGTAFIWAAVAGAGTVTSVSGTGTVSGISLSGTVTTAGSLTLGGSLDISNYTGTVGGTGFSTYLASPPAIGSTAANTGAFTTLSASSTVSGSGFSTYLASPPPIGGTTPAAGTFTNISSATAPTNTVGALSLTGTPNNATGGKVGVLAVGSNFTASDKNIMASFVQNINDYTQIIVQNPNAGTSASADFVVNNDNTTGSGTYGDFGINSSAYSGSGSFALPNATYLYSFNGELVVGTQTANGIRFVVNNGTTDAATISSAGVFSTTNASLTTPALTGATVSTNATFTAGTNAQGQGTITQDNVVVTTTAANPSGVTLPTATAGRCVRVVNNGTNPINIYPATGAQIDALGTNISISLVVGDVLEFVASSTTQWYSTANSATNASALVGTVSIASGGTGATTAGGAIAGLKGFTTTATAGGSTTLTSASTINQLFTGTLAQTIVLPVTSTLVQGWEYCIVNNSSNILTVNSSGGNLVGTISPGSGATFRCILTTGTTAASWDWSYDGLIVDSRIVPQNIQAGNYVLTADDIGRHIYHAAGAGIATYTIPANSAVPYEIGTTLTFINMSTNAVTIAINTDTLFWTSGGSTTSRTLAQYGVATAIKMTATTWLISGSNLT